ncbi:hypothetical protein [Kitasatospora sp. NPDC056731]|uniref:hypothetical protein n=1 Tax=Kitasatospora sp. NPDC056731 TaxID=3155422 RepID=UPI0034433A1C
MTYHEDGTRIHNVQGQTHTGSGAQYNFYYRYDSGERLIRGGGDPLRVALEHRRWLGQRFIAPSGYGSAIEKLKTPGSSVLVSGPSGAGRRTAAVVLLHRAGKAGDPFREISLDGLRDEPTELAMGERVLFDLSDVSEEKFFDAQALLKTYWGRVERCCGWLAVVLPPEHDHLLRSEFRQLVVSIGRPNGGAVLQRHLRRADIEVSRSMLDRSVLGELLGSSPMRELQQLSELVIQARSQGGEFDTWASLALVALRERGREAAVQIASLNDGRQRALLFTAAMLDGAPVDSVFRLSERLLSRVDYPEDERPRLDRTDLNQRLSELGVEVSEGRIRFKALAYGSAVRAHFWLYYPDLRQTFRTWVDDAVRATEWLDPAERQRLVGRFAEQVLNVGDFRSLTDLVEAWMEGTGLLPEALVVLRQGLMDERWGSDFRMRIYGWSIDPEIHPGLVRGLAQICVDVMAPHYPDQALVRLHHLARREEVNSSHYAREALLELARTDRRLYPRLLGRVCEGLERSEPWQPDAEIFLALVEPPPVEASKEVLARGWAAVLAVAPTELWASGVEAWLSAARPAEDGGEQLMEILIDAADRLHTADRRIAVLSRYYLLAYDWAATSDEALTPVSRADVAARFHWKIDRAQGIEPLDLSSAESTEGRGW